MSTVHFINDNFSKELFSQPEELVHVELDEGDRVGLLLLAVLSRHLKDRKSNIDKENSNARCNAMDKINGKN